MKKHQVPWGYPFCGPELDRRRCREPVTVVMLVNLPTPNCHCVGQKAYSECIVSIAFLASTARLLVLRDRSLLAPGLTLLRLGLLLLGLYLCLYLVGVSIGGLLGTFLRSRRLHRSHLLSIITFAVLVNVSGWLGLPAPSLLRSWLGFGGFAVVVGSLLRLAGPLCRRRLC